MCIICSVHSHAKDSWFAFASTHTAHAHAHLGYAEVARNERLLLLHALVLLGTASHMRRARHKHQRLGVALP